LGTVALREAVEYKRVKALNEVFLSEALLTRPGAEELLTEFVKAVILYDNHSVLKQLNTIPFEPIRNSLINRLKSKDFIESVKELASEGNLESLQGESVEKLESLISKMLKWLKAAVSYLSRI
jgi:hypothetical protein